MKQMKRDILLVVACLILASVDCTYGRIGETRKECDQRYGAPVQEFAGANGLVSVRVYERSGYRLIIGFVADQAMPMREEAGIIAYYKPELTKMPTGNTDNSHLTDEEQQGILSIIPGSWGDNKPAIAGLKNTAVPPTQQAPQKAGTAKPDMKEDAKKVCDCLHRLILQPAERYSSGSAYLTINPSKGVIAFSSSWSEEVDNIKNINRRFFKGVTLISRNCILAYRNSAKKMELEKKNVERPAKAPNGL